MDSWPFSDDRLRGMYAGGRGDATARRFARLWAAVFRLGVLPRRWVTLEVPGRRSGQVTRFPLGMADWHGQWYLVPMLGGQCNWVKNVRAADGQAVLRRRRAVRCRLAEVPASERAPIIRRYLEQVPGARPHIPVDRHAPVADFEAISPRYPVFQVVPDHVPPAPGSGTRTQARTRPNTPARKRRWWRWILAGTAATVVLVVLAAGLFVKLQPTAPPLALPAVPAGPPVGPLDGTWAVGAGSVAGFRLRETVLGFSNDVAGRTTAVTGTMVVSGGRVTSAMFRVDLTAVTVGGKAQPQFAQSLGTRDHPTATFTLAQPLALSSAFGSGRAVTVTATGYLAMNGVSRPVTFTISARRDGPAIEVAGSIPVTFAEWRIIGPTGYGFLGSLASHGAAEFLLVLHRSLQGT
jgi:polyisoprenoid-binding protein YceI